MSWRWLRCYERSKYTRKSHHTKKVLSEKEENQKAWREHKHLKDKKRAGLNGSWSGRNCPKWMKRHCNKVHRSWEKQCIFHERYDELGTWNHKRKDIFDPWWWD